MMDPRSELEAGRTRWWRAALAVGVALVYVAPWLLSPSDSAVFMKIGSIKGESIDASYKDWIEVEAESDAIRRLVQPGFSVPQALGPARFDEVFLRKRLDLSSVQLFTAAVSGRRFSDAEIHFVRGGGAGKSEPYLKCRLKNVLVTGITHDSAATGTEDLTLAIAGLTRTVVLFDDEGQPSGTIAAVWNVGTGEGEGSASGSGTSSDETGGDGTNDAPEVTGLEDQTTVEDGETGQDFTIGDEESSTDDLDVSCETSDSRIVPNENIVITGTGANRRVHIKPAPDAHGEVTITLIVTDGESVGVQGFTLTVVPINDPPTLGPIGPQVSDGDSPVEIPLQLGDVDTDVGSLGVVAHSDNPGVLPDENLQVVGEGEERFLLILPVPGVEGEARVTVEAFDGELSSEPVEFLYVANGPFTGEILDLAFFGGPVPEDAPPGHPVGIFEVVAPNAEEVQLSLLDNAGGRFELRGPELVVLDADRIDFEREAVHGILVMATDPLGGRLSRVFELEVLNINEPPEIRHPARVEAEPGAPRFVSGLRITDREAQPDDVFGVNLRVEHGVLLLDDRFLFRGEVVGNGSPEIGIAAPLSELATVFGYSDALAYRADGDFEGPDTLVIFVNDNGHRGEGEPRTAIAEVPVDVLVDAFDQWRRESFTPEELADPTMSGPLANFDRDMFSTVVEYGVGGDARRPDSEEAFGSVMELPADDGLVYPAIRFRRRSFQADPDLAVLVYVSTNGRDWDTGSRAVTLEAVEPIDDTFEWVTVRSNTPFGVGRQFFQVRFYR